MKYKFCRGARVFLLLAAFWLGPSRVAAVTNIWFSVDGTGDGTTAKQPRRYDPNFVLYKLLHTTPGLDHDVRLHFYPGEYLTVPINTVVTEPSDWRISIKGLGQHPEDVVLKLVPDYPKGASEGGGNWVDVIDLGRNNEYLQRFVMENLTVDGNWAGQTNVNHRAYLRGYKNCPVYVSARTGRIRNVIVRNYGAHGLMPQKASDLGAGVEVFPLHVFTREEGQEPEDGDPAPWVIEDCEVTGFHGLYGGYSTTLMAVAGMDPATADKQNLPLRRLIWFRGNQVRGNPDGLGVIGMGVAGLAPSMSGRVAWSDNTVLNGSGFNTDTGMLRWISITNCLLLDVESVGYLGTAQTPAPYHQSYQISGNSVRLVGHVGGRNYGDFRWTSDPSGRVIPQADPTLALGRLVPGNSSGLIIGGIARDIRFTDNWFTTRSREQFGRLGLLPPGREPGFRLVNRLPAKDPERADAPTLRRYDAAEVDLSGNLLSSVPFDFQRLKPVAGSRVAKLAEGSSPLLEKRLAVPEQDRFVAAGTVRRVAMLYTNVSRPTQPGAAAVSDRRLLSALEVVCGVPTRAGPGGKFRVPVRVALQPTPAAGMSGTRPLARRPVFLEVLPGSKHPQTLSAVTDADGVATFTYEVAAEANGVDRFRAWTDYGRGTREAWDEYQDAWATADYAHGTTVGVFVESDVANAAAGQPGRIRLVRTGTADRALTVKLAFAPGAFAAEAGRDYQLTGPPTTRVPGGKADAAGTVVASTVEFARGQRELSLLVEPLPKTARNAKLVTLQVQPGDGYAPGEPATGEVVVYAPGK